MSTADLKNQQEPSLTTRTGGTGLPLLIARVLLGFMFLWMGLAKTGYPELIIKKAGLSNSLIVQKIVIHPEIVTGPDGKLTTIHPGWVELGGPLSFLKMIDQYQMFPNAAWPVMNLIAVAMPWVEVLCGLLLILGVGVRGAAGLLLILLVVFTSAIVLRGVRIYNAGQVASFCAIQFNCGCGGGDVLICRKIPENLTLILLATYCLFSRANRFCLLKNIIPAGRGNPAPVPSE